MVEKFRRVTEEVHQSAKTRSPNSGRVSDVRVGHFLTGGTLTRGTTFADGTIPLCALRAAAVLSLNFCANFWSSLKERGDVAFA